MRALDCRRFFFFFLLKCELSVGELGFCLFVCFSLKNKLGGRILSRPPLVNLVILLPFCFPICEKNGGEKTYMYGIIYYFKGEGLSFFKRQAYHRSEKAFAKM